MGRAVAALAPERGFTVAATLGRPDARAITPAALAGADVAIEFTEPASAAVNAMACVAARCPVVVGTTGWYDRLPEVAAEVARRGGALVWAPNFSIGVNLFLRLVEDAARTMAGASFDAHVIETHHAAKRDAPSGTAQAIARVLSEGLGREVPVSSVRTGHVPGTHDVVFDAPFEQIRLEHAARDRRVFAEGALVAARWLVGRQGVFTMADVLSPREGAR
jgi:4-hydroxy-tetrahydrodipicolinate reductase